MTDVVEPQARGPQPGRGANVSVAMGVSSSPARRSEEMQYGFD